MCCDPILEMAISQDDLRAMYERLERNRAKAKPCFSGTPAVTEPKHYFNVIKEEKPRSKYGNIKVEFEGMKFDSKHELTCWKNLKLREKAGEISELIRQVGFDLEVNNLKIGKLTVDFTWIENGQYIVADAKSEITRKETAYRLRKRHFEAQYKPLVIREL